MPVFPRYESQEAINTKQQVGALAPEDTSYKKYEAMAETGKALGEIGLKFAVASDRRKANEAELGFKTGMDDVIFRAQNDPNPDNQDQYLNEIRQLQETHSKKKFVFSHSKDESFSRMGLDAQNGSVQIQNIFRNKEIDAGRATTLGLLDMAVERGGPGMQSEIQRLTQEGVQAGLFDRVGAQKLQKEYVKDGRYNQFLSDFRADPIGAEKKFDKDSYGMDVESAERARSKLKELKAVQREQEGNLYGDMSLKVMTGEASEREILSEIDANRQNPNEGITEAHGKTLLSSLYKDVTKRIGNKEFEKHKKAIDFVFSGSSQDRIKGYEAILEAYEDGLTTEDGKFLKKILDTKNDVIFAKKVASGQKILETLFGARPKNVQQETQFLLSYAKRIADGASPEAAVRETSLEVVEVDHPASILDPDAAVVFSPAKGLKNIPKVKRESSS